MNSRFTYNHTRFFYPTIADFANGVNGINGNTGDPTNYDLQNGRDSSGTSGINGREGVQFNRTIQSPNRTGSLGTINVNIEPQGATHYESYRQVDAHWDKTFRYNARRFSFNIDAFNLLNAAPVLARITRQDASNANFATTILAPRVLRFGLKVNF
ncbi:MAG: hypothetical protein DMF95_06735 [Acidobacteria bacterium]|nr:MAG: hypothetical protein DMF95_06735 [Acidobacteriota bacterium]